MLGPETNWLNAVWACRHTTSPTWDRATECGQPCTLHVMLDDGEGFIGACAEHESDALKMPHIDSHPWGQWCMMPGSLWLPPAEDSDSRCVLDDSGEEPALFAAVARDLAAAR